MINIEQDILYHISSNDLSRLKIGLFPKKQGIVNFFTLDPL